MKQVTDNTLFNHIPLMRPWLEIAEWEALKEVILSGWVSQGPKVQEFEQVVANFVGAKYGIATNSCTSAIHLALHTQGIQPGDEVILSDFTCMADANAILMAGAIPVFADIDIHTFNLDPNHVELCFTEKTKGILIIDQIGMPANLDEITELARKHDCILVDDAATSLGATYKGKYLGGHGIPTTYSFHPRKMITTGEGGMLVTDNPEINNKARILRSAGASVSDLERHKAKGTILQKYATNGFNYRLTDIQAAIGLIQMNRLPEMIRIRNEQAMYYSNAIQEIDELEPPFIPSYAKSCFSSYLIKIRKGISITPSDVIHHMADKSISCRYGIMPIHREPYFTVRSLKDEDYPASCDVASRSFFIPIFPGLLQEEMDKIVKTLKSVFVKKPGR
ncbi:DegT/DnrJ/EryC1/StrS family aminotransferase [bacterium]|nr:DegT/DnrJ/EryC1/StrS family aminotransferase [bacterium]